MASRLSPDVEGRQPGRGRQADDNFRLNISIAPVSTVQRQPSDTVTAFYVEERRFVLVVELQEDVELVGDGSMDGWWDYHVRRAAEGRNRG